MTSLTRLLCIHICISKSLNMAFANTTTSNRFASSTLKNSDGMARLSAYLLPRISA